jgi:hypothetical protein
MRHFNENKFHETYKFALFHKQIQLLYINMKKRTGKQPSCGIDEGFQEAITAHMSTRAYLEGRTMYWDADKEEITRG